MAYRTQVEVGGAVRVQADTSTTALAQRGGAETGCSGDIDGVGPKDLTDKPAQV